MFGLFAKPKPTARLMTGVTAILSASHRDQKTGQIHGHTWEITAWFQFKAHVDQSTWSHCLRDIVAPLDHTCLPDAIAWGERLAEYVGNSLNAPYWDGPATRDCVAVDVARPSERIYARWEA
jgi:hypothetical protein